MSDVAELHIRPRLIGDVGSEIRRTTTVIDNAHQRQLRMLGQGERSAGRLARAYHGVSRAVGTIGAETGRAIRSIFSLRSAITGIVVGGAGRSLFEATIGSADDMQRSRDLMRLTLRDASLVAEAEQRAVELTTEVASLSRRDAMMGMRTMMRMADGDVERAAELVRMAKALESLDPAQGFEGAVFALQELETGDTMSLRSRFRFRPPTRAEAEEAAAEAGTTMIDYYYEWLQNELDTRHEGGITGLLEVDASTIRGQWQMIVSIFQDALGEIGKEANDVLRDRLPALIEDLRDWMESDDFKESARWLARNLVSAAEGAVELARSLPETLQSLGEFYREHEDLIKYGGATLGVNFLTGGLVTRAAGGLLSRGGGLLRSGVGRLLGRRGGAAGGAVGSLASAAGSAGAVPVYVTNWGGAGGGTGQGSFLGRNALGGAGAAGAGTAGSAAAGGGVSAVGIGGAGIAGAALAGTAIFGSIVGGIYTLGEVFEGTSGFVETIERWQREEEERQQRSREIHDRGVERERQRVEEEENDVTVFTQRRLYGEAGHQYGALNDIVDAFTSDNQEAHAQARLTLEDVLGGPDAIWEGGENAERFLADLNASLSWRAGHVSMPEIGQPISELQFQAGFQHLTPAQQEEVERIEARYMRVATDSTTGEPLYPEQFSPALHAEMQRRQVGDGQSMYDLIMEQQRDAIQYYNPLLETAQRAAEQANFSVGGRTARSRYVGVHVENLTINAGEAAAGEETGRAILSEADRAMIRGVEEEVAFDETLRQAELTE